MSQRYCHICGAALPTDCAYIYDAYFRCFHPACASCHSECPVIGGEPNRNTDCSETAVRTREAKASRPKAEPAPVVAWLRKLIESGVVKSHRDADDQMIERKYLENSRRGMISRIRSSYPAMPEKAGTNG